MVAVPHAPQLCNRSDGQVWEQLEQLLVKGLQRAGELLGKHNEFSVITGAADLMGQSKGFGTVHRNGLREEQALRCRQVLDGIIQREQARSEIVQMNVTELANPKRGKYPILVGRAPVLPAMALCVGRNSSISPLVSTTTVKTRSHLRKPRVAFRRMAVTLNGSNDLFAGQGGPLNWLRRRAKSCSSA